MLSIAGVVSASQNTPLTVEQKNEQQKMSDRAIVDAKKSFTALLNEVMKVKYRPAYTLTLDQMQSAYDNECIPKIAQIVKNDLGSYTKNKDDTYVRSFIRAYVDLICDSLASNQLYYVSKIRITDIKREEYLQYLNSKLIFDRVIPMLKQWKKDSPKPAVQTADLNEVYGSLNNMLAKACHKVTYATRKSSLQSVKKFLDQNIELLRNLTDDLDILRSKTQPIWDAANQKAKERNTSWLSGVRTQQNPDDIDFLQSQTESMFRVYLALLWT